MKKIKIEIKNRITGKVLFEYKSENNNIKKTVIKAVNRGADLRGAYLTGADLRGADLTGAYLRGADNIKITVKKTQVFTGIYKYLCMPIIDENNKEFIRLGCYTRLVSDWENDFWNNDNEFPNNNSIDSKLRILAYKTCKKWLKLNR